MPVEIRHGHERERRDEQAGRDPPVRDLDDELGVVERWKPQTVALGPVVSTAHPRVGDAHDRAEYDLRVREAEREVREEAVGDQRRLTTSEVLWRSSSEL